MAEGIIRLCRLLGQYGKIKSADVVRRPGYQRGLHRACSSTDTLVVLLSFAFKLVQGVHSRNSQMPGVPYGASVAASTLTNQWQRGPRSLRWK